MMEVDENRLEELVREAECETGDCSCEEFAEHLFELIDAEMPEAEAQRLAAHAENCPNCTERSAAEKHLRNLLRAACCEQSAPEQLRARIVEQFSLQAREGSVQARYRRSIDTF